MTPKITNEQRDALHAHPPGEPVRVEDDRDHRVYYLVSPEDVPQLWNDYVSVEVGKGLDAVERGEVGEWNPNGLKERARAAAGESSMQQ